MTFSLQVNNIGGTNAVGITVQDNLPAGLTFLSAADASNPNRGFVCGAAGSVEACHRWHAGARSERDDSDRGVD